MQQKQPGKQHSRERIRSGKEQNTMPEPEKNNKAGVLDIDELIAVANEAVQTHRTASDRQALYENLQREAKEQSARLEKAAAEDYGQRAVPIAVNPESWKHLEMQEIQEKLDDILRKLPEMETALGKAKQEDEVYHELYQQCVDVFAQAADADDLVAMGRELRRLSREAEELTAGYEYTCRDVEELQARYARTQAEDYSKKTGAKIVNPDLWKRMELMEIEENLNVAYDRLPDLKTSAEDAQYRAELFRKAFESSLERFIRDDKERLTKLRNDYIKDEMQDTIRKQRERIIDYNWSFEERDNKPIREKGLKVHVNKLLDSRDNRHSSEEWDRMCEALSELHISDVLDQMWDPREPFNYDKEQMQKLRKQIDEAILQTGRYVDTKKDSFLVKLGLGKGPGYLREARESLRAMKHIRECIDTIDQEHKRLVKEADRRYKPELVTKTTDSERKTVTVERTRSSDMEREAQANERKSVSVPHGRLGG